MLKIKNSLNSTATTNFTPTPISNQHSISFPSKNKNNKKRTANITEEIETQFSSEGFKMKTNEINIDELKMQIAYNDADERSQQK